MDIEIKNDEVLNKEGELIGDFCQNKQGWCYIAEAFIHRYTVEDLEGVLRHLKRKRVKNDEQVRKHE